MVDCKSRTGKQCKTISMRSLAYSILLVFNLMMLCYERMVAPISEPILAKLPSSQNFDAARLLVTSDINGAKSRVTFWVPSLIRASGDSYSDTSQLRAPWLFISTSMDIPESTTPCPFGQSAVCRQAKTPNATIMHGPTSRNTIA